MFDLKNLKRNLLECLSMKRGEIRDRTLQTLTDRYISKKSHLEDVTFCVDSN